MENSNLIGNLYNSVIFLKNVIEDLECKNLVELLNKDSGMVTCLKVERKGMGIHLGSHFSVHEYVLQEMKIDFKVVRPSRKALLQLETTLVSFNIWSEKDDHGDNRKTSVTIDGNTIDIDIDYIFYPHPPAKEVSEQKYQVGCLLDAKMPECWTDVEYCLSKLYSVAGQLGFN